MPKEDTTILTTWTLLDQAIELLAWDRPGTWIGVLALGAMVLRVGVKPLGQSNWQKVRAPNGTADCKAGRSAFAQEMTVNIAGLKTYIGVLKHAAGRFSSFDHAIASALHAFTLPMYQEITRRTMTILNWAVDEQTRREKAKQIATP
jgi:hypothetical protein